MPNLPVICAPSAVQVIVCMWSNDIVISRHRLKWLFFLFFIALVIPVSLLSWRAYEQLRWESVYQYQQEARSLSLQIIQSLMREIDKQEVFSDGDYRFFTLKGDPGAGFLQRSELSKYPVESSFPGLIGYFQVDEQGVFSTPLLPDRKNAPKAVGLRAEDVVLRQQLELSIRNILSENRLVDSPAIAPVRSVSDPVELDQLASSSLKKKKDRTQNDQDIHSDEQVYIEEAMREEKQESESKAAPPKEAQMSKVDKLKYDRDLSASNGFSRLKSAKEQRKISTQLSQGEIPKQQQVDQAELEPVKLVKKQAAKRKNRRENNYIPELQISADQPLLDRMVDPANKNQIQIHLFESEVEPFQFSLLASGHFVLYRQVWRNQQRVIQGAVISAKNFFDTAFGQPFKQSPLQSFIRLSIVQNEQELSAYDSVKKADKIQQLPFYNHLLYSTVLSEPFSGLSLNYYVQSLPVGAGARYIRNVSLVLLIVMLGGTYSLYRLSKSQMELARQQQNFVSSVSHELKTPLTSIRMYGEILQQGWVNEEKKREYYDFISQESERLSRLISNVLQVSRLDQGTLELDLKMLTIAELQSMIHSKVDAHIKQSGFVLNVCTDKKTAKQSIKVDADAFIQVVINLIDNAIKFSQQQDKKQIDLTFKYHKSDRIELVIRDYGPGVSSKNHKKIFKLFYRSENEMTRETKGTGIGLALVKELCDAMNARVSVKNQTPGAEFSVLFK